MNEATTTQAQGKIPDLNYFRSLAESLISDELRGLATLKQCR